MTKWWENRCQVRASVSTFQSPHVGFPSSWAVWEWSVLFCYQILPRLTESLYKFSLCQPPDQTRVFICRRQPEPDIKKKTLDNTLILLIWLASYNFVAWHTVVLWTISKLSICDLSHWVTHWKVCIKSGTWCHHSHTPRPLISSCQLGRKWRFAGQGQNGKWSISHLTPSHETPTLNTVTR